MIRLNIRRESNWVWGGRKFKIFLDENLLGKIGNGELMSFEIPEGIHEIQIRADFCKSEKFISTNEMRNVDLVCGTPMQMSDIHAPIAVLIGLLKGRRMLFLRKETEDPIESLLKKSKPQLK